MHKVDSGKGLGNARGRRKPSISECTHTDDIQHVRNVRNKKKTKCEFAGGCGSAARWYCLAANCGAALCGKLAHNHSDEHNRENPTHYLQLTSKGRVWCFACRKEVQILPSETPATNIKEEPLPEKKRVMNSPKPVKRRHDSPERMETDEEGATENRALLPKAAAHTDDIASRTGLQGPPIPNSWNMAMMVDERADQMGGLTGLLNLGNTCYMNAALQALSNCPPIREYMRTYPIPVNDGTDTSLVPSAGTRLPVTQAFRDVILRIWSNASRHAISPRILLMKVREQGPQFRGYAQQDSQEFIRCFLDWLHQELKRPVRAWEEELIARERERSTSPKPSSLGSSSSSSRNDLDSTGDANDNFETADSGLSSDTDDSREGKDKQKKANANKVLRYHSIISDVFDGELVSTVKCLTCHQLSNTKETFQDISLSIPTIEQLELMREAAMEVEKSHPMPNTSASEDGSYLSWLYSVAARWLVQPWVSWLSYFYRYMFTGAITLENCLKAFFSADHLHGEDMYSCDKCAKLRNGVKLCKVMRLPEILCIHLKRFRHDSMYNTKIGTRVTFPLCDLDMAPFVGENISQDDRLDTQYDLVAIVVHHGSSVDYGHYVAYCLNDVDKNWYEYDDSHVTRVSEPEVMSKEAYVLFYRKKTSDKTEQIREHVKELMRKPERASVASSRHWISHEWLWKFFTFSEPGPISNTEFLCPHGNLSPTLSDPQELSSYVVTIPERAWDFLHERYGGGPPCQQLAVCFTCRQALAAARLRKERELNVFRSLNESTRYRDYLPDCVVPKHWIERWKEFVTQLNAEPPGPIDNEPMLHKLKDSYRLRTSANYVPISYEAWNFFQQTYGGGPMVFKLLTRNQLTAEEVAEKLHEAEEAQRSAREQILKALSGENAEGDESKLLQITDSEV